MSASIRRLWLTPGPQPNGLHAAADGLWVIDQVDNKVYRLDYSDGRVLSSFDTDTCHSSGITIGGNMVWIASTWTYQLIGFDISSGKQMAILSTPGGAKAGAHGLEWRDSTLWVNVPKTGTIYQLDPQSGSVVHSIPAPGQRPHGMAWEGDLLWCAETTHKALYKLDPRDGTIVERIEVASPEPHGMTMWGGEFWMCDAGTREVFTLTR